MKKILSIILASAMLIALMSTTVLAGEEPLPGDQNVIAGKEYWVVGTQGEGPAGINNGVTTPSGSATANIKINFNTGDNTTGTGNGGSTGDAIEDRYAVDIVYGELFFDLTKITMPTVDPADTGVTKYKFVWDVNTYEYKYVGVNGSGAIVDDAPASAAPSDPWMINAFKIINHSSMPIKYTPTLTNNVSGTKMSLTLSGDGVAVNLERVLAQADVDLANRKPVEGSMHTLTAAPAGGEHWLSVINDLASNPNFAGDGGASKGVIGTITVTIEAYVTPTP